jgi:hypothetical protein
LLCRACPIGNLHVHNNPMETIKLYKSNSNSNGCDMKSRLCLWFSSFASFKDTTELFDLITFTTGSVGYYVQQTRNLWTLRQ